MKHDNPTVDEIREMIDAMGEARHIGAEYSVAPSAELDAGVHQVNRILRYALRCRLAEDRAMSTDHNTESGVMSGSLQVAITGNRGNRTDGICLYCGREDFHNELCPNFVDDDYTG